MLPVWRLHEHIGMGGDKFVVRQSPETRSRSASGMVCPRWEQLFDGVIEEVAPLEGAHKLMAEL